MPGAPLPRLAVLASGRGTNLQAIVDAIAGGNLDAELAGVFCDRPGAAALARVPASLRWSEDPAGHASRAAFDRRLGDAVAKERPDWIVCAGYLRLLSDGFVQRFHGRILNIHPSLLPKYPGLRTHARALEAGDPRHGASVHFVSPELDAGAVVAQATIRVVPGDSPAGLAARVLEVEHPLLVSVLQLAVAGRLAEHDGKVMLDGHPLFMPLQLDSAGTFASLAPTTPAS